MDVLTVLADNIRRLRKTANLTQEGLGLKAGLNRTYVGGIERKNLNPTVGNIQKIVDALEVEPADLFAEARETQSAKWTTVPDGIIPFPDARWLLCENAQGAYSFHPIDVHSEDLSIRILSYLIDEGHRGSELAERYNDLEPAILEFARARSKTGH